MNKISNSDVQHLADLSGLELSSDEISDIQKNLAEILDYFDNLKQLDTSDVKPTYQINDLENVYRDDIPDQGVATRQQLLELAPDRTENSIKTPKVI